MSYFIKGPWKVSINGSTVSILTDEPGVYGKGIALCQQVHKPETIANAKLIAAAPSLFQSLQNIVNYAEAMGWHQVEFNDNRQELFKEARQVLMKAEGRQS